MILAHQLRRLLRDNDITVAQLARATSVSSKTIYQWLQGTSPRNLVQLKTIADYFSVSVDHLVFDSKSETSHRFQNYKEDIDVGLYEVVLRPVKKDIK